MAIVPPDPNEALEVFQKLYYGIECLNVNLSAQQSTDTEVLKSLLIFKLLPETE